MRTRSSWAAIAVVAALGALAGCGGTTTPPGGPSGPWPAPNRQRDSITSEQRAALQTWAAFPVSASKRPLVLTQGAVDAPIQGFHTSEEKEAFLAGAVVGPQTLPPSPPVADGYPIITASDAITVVRATGGGKASLPLRVTAIRLASSSFATDRGAKLLPAWLLSFGGVLNPASVLAVSPSLLFPLPAASAGGSAMMSATIATDDRTLTVAFVGSPAGTGPCTADYVAAAAESDHAVAILISETRPAGSSGQACTALGFWRHATVQLHSPLDGRVVVEAHSDAPVAVN